MVYDGYDMYGDFTQKKAGYAKGTVSSNSCSGCIRGSYSSISAATVCTACAAGRYGSSNFETNSACTGIYQQITSFIHHSSHHAISVLFSDTSFVLTLSTMLVADVLNMQGDCSAGYWCPAGSWNATSVPCPAGSYSISIGLSSPTCDGLCSPGYYCPAGSNSPTAFQCPGIYFIVHFICFTQSLS
jgi:hypothetical protein